jgi:hypothetical protein
MDGCIGATVPIQSITQLLDVPIEQGYDAKDMIIREWLSVKKTDVIPALVRFQKKKACCSNRLSNRSVKELGESGALSFKDESSSVNNHKLYTILTEEAPTIEEINFIIKHILHIEPPENTISPILNHTSFNGEWEMKINACVTIIIKLFKGESSCVDYLVYEGYVDDNTNAGTAICILESTKTTDKSSRNTSVNQRITKFMVFDKLYPTSKAIKVMFYNEEWIGQKLTDTGVFGLALMKSLNINAYHVTNNMYENLYDKYKVDVFQTITELINAKNKINEKLGNVSIKINNHVDNYYISCKLDKGVSANSGKISHDPNVGLLCGLINFIHSKNKQAKITIQNHNISQEYFDKSPKSKFWYAIHGIPINFEHIQNIRFPSLPTKYFTLEKRCTEKLATILFSQVISKNYKCVFSNHSGCALSNIKTYDKDITVERTMPRPDILFHNNEKKELFIIEGKIEKDIKLGITQLNDAHLERFIVLIKTAYPECIIKKGLCVTIDSIENIQKYQSLEYPVVFALDSNGIYYSML